MKRLSFLLVLITLVTSMSVFANEEAATEIANEQMDTVMTAIKASMDKENIECKIKLNLGSNLFRVFRGELRVGFVCKDNDTKGKIEGSALIKGVAIRGCDDAEVAAQLAKIPVAPVGSECKTNSNGTKTFEALYLKSVELKVDLF